MRRRLELIRTLRELGLGLADVRRVLAGERTVAEVAAAHVTALDAQIRSLKVTRAVLSSVARRGSTAEEMTLMNKLARLSAAGRKRIVDDFMSRLVHHLATSGGEALRQGVGPADPAAEEILRGLLGDADRAAVLDRLTATANVRVARYRRVSAIVNGVGPQPSYDAEFSWVVAALRAHQGR